MDSNEQDKTKANLKSREHDRDDAVIHATAQHVKDILHGEGTGHDWWHTLRVWNNAKEIGRSEDVDMRVVELAAILHDIGDYKLHCDESSIGSKLACDWLEKNNVDEDTISHVCSIIQDMDFKGGSVETPMKTIEGKVVQDADRLDALGAIGIARAFAYGGKVSRPLHDPTRAPRGYASFEEYKRYANSSTINHFYEKILKIKDMMNTATGKKHAENRHAFVEVYLKQFLDEWVGKD